MTQMSRRIVIKTDNQIAGIRRSCQLTVQTLDMVAERLKPGITTNTINNWVDAFIRDHGGIPAPLGYRGYPKSVCVSVNDVILHGIPDGRILEVGDILNVDVTSILDGYFGDASRMYCIGSPSSEAKRLIDVTRSALENGIEQVKPGNTIGHIGHAIQRHVENAGYSVVRDYVGHGTGIRFHEPPEVLHFGRKGHGAVLRPGMVFTIEPMVNAGSRACRTLEDRWTVVTVDGSLSAQWEHTVLVTQTDVEVLTA